MWYIFPFLFLQSQYTVSSPEEEAIGQIFVTLEASDNDGTTANSEITYTITSSKIILIKYS